MKCDKNCIHFPCTKKECGENEECKDYISVVSEAIKIINKYNKEKK